MRTSLLHRPDALLRLTAVLYGVGLVVHTADHLRRGISVVTGEVFWGGNVLAALAIVAIALVFAGHRQAPLVAMFVGFTAAIGVSASHLLPHWSSLSDSLPDGNVDAWTWIAVLIEIGGALAFGAAGAYALLRQRDTAIDALR
jgi:hypothetical protein